MAPSCRDAEIDAVLDHELHVIGNIIVNIINNSNEHDAAQQNILKFNIKMKLIMELPVNCACDLLMCQHVQLLVSGFADFAILKLAPS